MLLVDGNSGAKPSIRLVRGCPCYKVFGNEKLCVNDDNVLGMEVIELDPTLFAMHKDKAAMDQERADCEDICYCSIFINYPENKVYCISQGWAIRIHARDVIGSDLEDALQFLTTKDMAQNAEICSECLYKFLLTLSDHFADTMTRKEKTDEVKRYVDKFSLMIAVKHSQVDSTMQPIGTEDDIQEGIDHFGFLRNYLVQLLDQQGRWSAIADRMYQEGREEWAVSLARNREKLARAEFQFYSQTLQLRDINDFNLLIRMLSFVLRTADEILTINTKIHGEIRTERFAEVAKIDQDLALLASYADKSRTVEHNFGNVLQILSKL